MSKRIEPWADVTGRSYLIVGLTAAVLLAFSLVERGAGMWAILAPLIAAAGLVFGWTAAPVFVLLGTAMALLVLNQRFYGTPTLTADLILAGAVTAYSLSHFRLCAVTVSVFPSDSRRMLTRVPARRMGPPPLLKFLMMLTVAPYVVYLISTRGRTTVVPPEPVPRDGTHAGADEIIRALLSVAVAAVLAVTVWVLTTSSFAPLQTYPRHWQLGLVAWILVVPLTLAVAVIGYRSWRRMTPEVGRMHLLEGGWRETRREQRRMARWTAWARLKQDAAQRAKP